MKWAQIRYTVYLYLMLVHFFFFTKLCNPFYFPQSQCCGRNFVVCRSINTLITLRVDLHIYEMETTENTRVYVCVDIRVDHCFHTCRLRTASA